MNLADGIEIQARRRPDHPAVVAGARTISHAEFAARVRRIAAHLGTFGTASGDVVGVALQDTVEHLAVLFALARSGRVILPLDCRWTAAETRRVAEHFSARLVLVPAAGVDLGAVRAVAVDDAWQAAVERAAIDTAPAGGNPRLLVSLSSGTTGRPKGPMITHEHFFRRFMTHWIDLGLNARDRFVCATPLYFGGGRTFAMSVLFAGGTVVLFAPPHDAADLVAEIVRTDATSVFLVPTQLRRLLELPAAALAPLRRLGLVLSSGAPLTAAERARIRDAICPNFCEYYASTEGGGVSLLRPEDQASHGDSVGQPIFGVEVEIVDDDHRPLPPGSVGRLRYRGPGVATGYYRDPEASREAFRDGWFYPGDLAEHDARGYITLRGRIRDLIIRGGVNIHPAEIEATLTDHPQVSEAAVVGWPSPSLGEEVAAFVRLRGPAEPAELVDWCRQRLAPYKKPRQVFVIDDFPRNSAGKVVKKTLAATLPPLA
jgi:acyl-CoA synthetase (AMP-forming)/AMP-acid ligase II